MRKVIYLLSDGKLGLPGASKMFVEMVAVKKDNPSKYYMYGLQEQSVG